MTSRERDRLIRHQAYSRAYLEWFEALPEAERFRLKALGLNRPEGEQFGAVHREDEGTKRMEHADPERQEISVQDETELMLALRGALQWCFEGGNVVDVGWRYLCVLNLWKPVLIEGLALEFKREMMTECMEKLAPLKQGPLLGRILEWPRRARLVSQVGVRILAMAYVINPGVMGTQTLESIGAPVGKTRQAVDKLVQDFRDTFGGIKSRAMRSEENRKTCQQSQLSKRHV